MKIYRLLAAALVLVLAVAAPAYALDGYEESYRGTPTGGGCGDQGVADPPPRYGYVCFVDEGDVFYLIDEAADGSSIAAQWKLTDGSRAGLIRDRLGEGVNSILNKDFAESKTVKFRMGKCNQSATNDCRDPGDYNSYTYTICVAVDGSRNYGCSW